MRPASRVPRPASRVPRPGLRRLALWGHYARAMPDAPGFGEPGPPLSRQAPFLRGFFGGLGLLAALLVGLVVREAASVLTLVLIAAFLAVSLEPVVALLTRRGLPRGRAVLVVSVVVFGALLVIALVLGTALGDQIARLVDNAPHLLDDLRRNRTVRTLDSHFHLLPKLEQKLRSDDLAANLAGGVLDFGVSVFNVVADTIVVMVLTVYVLAGLPRIKAAMYSLAPASRRERVARLGDEVMRRAGGYAIGAVLVALGAGTVTTLFLVSVGLAEYALAVGLLVALLDLLPLVGALLGAGTVIALGFATSVPVGVAALIFYILYEGFEGYVLYPRVMRATVAVPEYVTIIAVLLGGAVAGIVGALLALPLAAGLLLIVREVWVRRQDQH